MEARFTAKQVWDVRAARALLHAMQKTPLWKIGAACAAFGAVLLALCLALDMKALGWMCFAVLALLGAYAAFALEPMAARNLFKQRRRRWDAAALTFETTVWTLVFNCSDELLQNLSIRQALAASAQLSEEDLADYPDLRPAEGLVPGEARLSDASGWRQLVGDLLPRRAERRWPPRRPPAAPGTEGSAPALREPSLHSLYNQNILEVCRITRRQMLLLCHP